MNQNFIDHNKTKESLIPIWKEDAQQWSSTSLKCVECGDWVTYNNARFFDWNPETVKCFRCQQRPTW